MQECRLARPFSLNQEIRCFQLQLDGSLTCSSTLLNDNTEPGSVLVMYSYYTFRFVLPSLVNQSPGMQIGHIFFSIFSSIYKLQYNSPGSLIGSALVHKTFSLNLLVFQTSVLYFFRMHHLVFSSLFSATRMQPNYIPIDKSVVTKCFRSFEVSCNGILSS